MILPFPGAFVSGQVLRSTRVPVTLVVESELLNLPVLVDDTLIPGLGYFRMIRGEYGKVGLAPAAADFEVWCVLSNALPVPDPAAGWNTGFASVPSLGSGLYLAALGLPRGNLVILPKLYGPHPRTGSTWWYAFLYPGMGPDLPLRIAAFVKAHQGLQGRNTRGTDIPASGSPSYAGFFPPVLGSWR